MADLDGSVTTNTTIHKLERERLITIARGDKILIDARLPADSLHRAAMLKESRDA